MARPGGDPATASKQQSWTFHRELHQTGSWTFHRELHQTGLLGYQLAFAPRAVAGAAQRVDVDALVAPHSPISGEEEDDHHVEHDHEVPHRRDLVQRDPATGTAPVVGDSEFVSALRRQLVVLPTTATASATVSGPDARSSTCAAKPKP